MLGQTISHYRIEEELGSGGMGVVYRARDLRLHRTVALKFLPHSLQRDDSARDRLVQEAQRASALDHPNICTIFQFHEADDGRSFLAMAFYEGETLTDRLRRAAGPLPIAEAFHIAAQTASGLAAAHEHGIVHCDVKPGNVMLTGRGDVKILDFGIARVAGASGKKVAAIGTVPYMSPEQLRREPLDARTDVWSLGVVLYQMVTGVRPFRAKGQDAVRRRIFEHEPAPVTQHLAHQNARLNQILRWALAKEPADRYPSAAELQNDLQSLRVERPRGAVRVMAMGDDTTGETTGPRGTGPYGFGSSGAGAHARAEGQLLGVHAAAQPAIVVLPLRDLSAEKDQEHLCFGIAEELITRLTSIEGIRVATRTPMTGDELESRSYGRRLDVTHVLEGSVRKGGNRLRVTARLVLVGDGTVAWSAKYDRDLESVFDIQDELAERITEALEAPLRALPATTRPGDSTTGNFDAYDQYLKGRYAWNRRTETDLRSSIYHFEMAISEEPGYARAHAGLADTYTMLGIYGIAPPAEVMPRAKTAAQEALRLDASLAEAYAARGCVRSAYEWDFTGAGTDFRHAIELDPRYATAHQWYAMNCLLPKKRFEHALDQLGRASDLDPLSLPIGASIGIFFYCAEQLERAVEELENILESESGLLLARITLAKCLCLLGRADEALDMILQVAELQSADPLPTLTRILGVVHAAVGQTDHAWTLLEQLVATSDGRYVAPTLIAELYLALDEHDLALAALERALRLRSADLIWLGVDPFYRPLRGNPRFRAVLAEIGLERRY